MLKNCVFAITCNIPYEGNIPNIRNICNPRNIRDIRNIPKICKIRDIRNIHTMCNICNICNNRYIRNILAMVHFGLHLESIQEPSGLHVESKGGLDHRAFKLYVFY